MFDREAHIDIEIAFSYLGNALSTALSPTVASEIFGIATQLTKIRQDREKILAADKLQGRGPVSDMRDKLLLDPHPGTTMHLPDDYKDEHRYRSIITDLIKEFFSSGQSGYNTGGLFNVNFETETQVFKDAPYDLPLQRRCALYQTIQSGFYTTPTGGELVLHFPVDYSLHILRIRLDPGRLESTNGNEKFIMEMLSWVDVEKEWVVHDWFSAIPSKDYLKSRFKTALRDHGFQIPTKISLIELDATLMDIIVEKTPNCFDLFIVNGINCMITDRPSRELLLSNDRKTDGTRIKWPDVNASTQHLIMDKLYKLAEPIVKDVVEVP